MSKQEEKMIYRIFAQKEGITVKAETANDVTFDEAKQIAVKDVLGKIDKEINFEPFVILPLTTKERWEEGTINFCPRCGSSLKDYEFEQYANFDCHECNASIEVSIMQLYNEE